MCDVLELVAACCVLHNICEIHGECFDDSWMEGVHDETHYNQYSMHNKSNG